MQDPASGESDASDPERLDRELAELLQELRVLLPGTTVLFGFLLALAFTRTFEAVRGAERVLFTVAFLTTALCVVLLVAPGVRHRTRFRERDKEALIRSANRVTLVASALLAISLAAVTTLVCEHLYGWIEGLVAGSVLLLIEVALWFMWAVARRAGPPTARVDQPPADSGPADPGPRATGVVSRPGSRPGGPAPPGTPAAVGERDPGR